MVSIKRWFSKNLNFIISCVSKFQVRYLQQKLGTAWFKEVGELKASMAKENSGGLFRNFLSRTWYYAFHYGLAPLVTLIQLTSHLMEAQFPSTYYRHLLWCDAHFDRYRIIACSSKWSDSGTRIGWQSFRLNTCALSSIHKADTILPFITWVLSSVHNWRSWWD